MVSSKRNIRPDLLRAAIRALTEDPRDVNMRRVAEIAGVSRQAVYLHFENKAALLVAAARHLDAELSLDTRVAPLREAPDADTLLERYAEFLADYNPLLYPVVRATDAVRRADPDVAKAWSDRLANRRRGCHQVIKRLLHWGRLAPEWDRRTATIWLTAQSSVKLWEELVMDLGLSRKQYVAIASLSMRRALLGG